MCGLRVQIRYNGISQKAGKFGLYGFVQIDICGVCGAVEARLSNHWIFLRTVYRSATGPAEYDTASPATTKHILYSQQ